jgi:hypothetical protein
VLQHRPAAVIVTQYFPSSGQWTVASREPGSTQDLARLVIDDTTREVTSRYFLPFDRYPPRLKDEEVWQAILRSTRAQETARRWGPLRDMKRHSRYVDGVRWEVGIYDDKRRVMLVEVSDTTAAVEGIWTGHQMAWEMARGHREAFGGELNRPVIWGTFMAAFLIVLLPWGRLRSLQTADIVAIAGIGVSLEFFNRGMIEWSVPTAVPPLAWLLGRSLLQFFRGAAPLHVRWLPTWALVGVALFATGVRYAIAIWDGTIVDVGYAGVAGATGILDGLIPYGNMPADNRHGDTYGPLNYLLYVPATIIFGGIDRHAWGDSMPAARATTIAADLACMLALVSIGWRWLSRRSAALLAAAWATCPFTAYALCSHVNDVIVAALLLGAFALLPRPLLRGVFLGAAAAVKFVPLLVVPVLAHCGTRLRRRQAVLVLAGVTVMGCASLAFLFAYEDGPRRFADATWGFQYERTSPFSIWGMYGWRTGQQIAQAAVVLLAAVMLLRPAVRDVRQVAAGAAAVLIATQLVLQHWSYLYIPWFIGFLLIVIVASRELAAGPARSSG